MTDRRLLLALRDASTIATRYHIARQHADECRAGWPAQTIGASPNATPTPTNHDPRPNDGIPHDPADRAHRRMSALLNSATRDLEELARLVDQWTPERWHTHQHTTAEAELAEIDGGLWCPNHMRYGHMEVRDTANRRKLCRWCDGVLRDTKILPDRELVDRRSRMGRISSRDIDQFRARNPTKKRKKAAA